MTTALELASRWAIADLLKDAGVPGVEIEHQLRTGDEGVALRSVDPKGRVDLDSRRGQSVQDASAPVAKGAIEENLDVLLRNVGKATVTGIVADGDEDRGGRGWAEHATCAG